MKRALFALLLALAPLPAVAAPRAMTAEDAYNLGLRYLNRANYTKALEQLNRVRTYYRDDPVALKAELAIADIHVRKDEWDAARVAYEDFMRAHPRYPELDYVVYRLGMVQFKKAPAVPDRDQTWTRQAVNTWTGFSARFPESHHLPEVDKLLTKARSRLAEKEYRIAHFYELRKAWPAVIGRTTGLVKLYPDTTAVAPALSLLTRAYAKHGDLDQAKATLEKLKVSSPRGFELIEAERAVAAAEAHPAQPASK